MKCHSQSIAADLAVAAHNVPAAQLAKITLTHAEGKSDAAPLTKACAACHQEHHGATFDLTAMRNDSCQACHQQRYHSFAEDHPDFGAWPYERRTRIAFDHASHQNKHFAEKHQPFECRTCHIEDATHRVEQLANYEATCASCHDEKIRTSVASGVPMFSLPTLDVAAIRSAGVNLGPWPEKATGDFDGRLPPLMKLLLAADPAAAQAMTVLGPDFEFADIDPQDAKQVRAAADVAVAIKKLLAELSQAGPEAVRSRLAALTGRQLTPIELDALVAGLSADTLRSAIAAWLPGENVGSAESNAETNAAQSEPSLTPPYKGGEIRSRTHLRAAMDRDDATFTIRYRLASHADPVLTSWLMASAAASSSDHPIAAAALKEMAKPTAPGLCASCHSIERTQSGQLAINWRSSTARPSRAPSPNSRTVRTCSAAAGRLHALPRPQSGRRHHRLIRRLEPATIRQRVSADFEAGMCRVPHRRAAGDSCQSCHNYHVEMIEPWRTAEVGSRELGVGHKDAEVQN